MNSIKLSNRMDSIFMKSRNTKPPDLHRLLLNLSDKINLKRKDKYVSVSILVFTIHGKTIHKKIIHLIKYHLKHGMKCLNYLMDHIMYHIFKNILSILSKNMKQLLNILQ